MSNQDGADKLNLKIHITESLPNFAEFTVVEAATPQQQLRTIYVEHLDEFHYVSTKHLVPYVCPIRKFLLMHLKLLNDNALLILVCIITRVVTVQITNQSKVLISFGKKELSICEHIAQTVLLIQSRKKLVKKSILSKEDS